MVHIGTDYPVILFLLLLVWRIRKADEERNTFIPPENGLSLRGIAAMVIFLYHLAQSTAGGILLPKTIFPLGRMFVAMFFFLSGYGLQKQYQEKGESYRKNFLKRRIPSILIPYTFFAIVYKLVYLALGKGYTMQTLVEDLRNGIPFVAHSWYVISILIFYLFFWILMKICKNRMQWMPLAACGWYIIYTVICVKLKFLMYWYDTAHLLPVGMFCAVHEKALLDTLKNREIYRIVVLTGLPGWLVTYSACASGAVTNMRLYYILSLGCAFSFVIMLVSVQLKVQVDNPVFRYLGQISLEIYMIHGLICYLLRGDYCFISSEPLYCFLCLTGVILAASLLHQADRFLLREWGRVIR